MEKVFIKRCSSYDDFQMMEIFEESINNTDSIKILKSGSKVLLKTNLLIKKKSEAAATTHPLFLRALAQVLIKRGFKVLVGDSPGGLFNKPHLNILDAIVGMDHNGPAAGKPIETKLVLASEDGFVLDLTALKIIVIDPMRVPVMKASFVRTLVNRRKS
jgi:uncharacterized protein (DUF362 family)